MTAAAVIAAAGSRVIQTLHDQGAFSRDSAAPINLHRRLDRQMLERLQRSGIVVTDAPNLYYLDRDALDAFDARIRKIKWWALGMVTAAAGVALIVTLL